MRKVKYTTCIITIVLTVCSIFALGVSATTPQGPSGLNYLALNDGDYYVTQGVTETVNNNGTISENVFIGSPNLLHFSTSYGYLDLTTGLPLNKVGDKFEVYIQFEDEYLLKHINASQKYYAGAVLFWNQQGDPTTYRVMADNIKFTTESGSEYVVRPTVGSADLPTNNPRITVMRIQWNIPEGMPSTNINTCYLQWLQLLQERPIDPTYLSGSMTATGFVPYNWQWFDGQDSYQAGYNEGYANGAEQASGGIIQRWGAFIKTAVDGFFTFEIYPGFSLWGLLATVVSIPLLLWFLKIFLGG